MWRRCTLVALLTAATVPAGSAAAGAYAGDGLVRVGILAERQSVNRGGTTALAIAFTPKPGWHIYWRNPGDSGAPPTIAWSLPRGVSIGPAAWPVPERIVTSGIATFVYAHPATLLVPLHVARAVAPGRYVVRADIAWFVCANVCVPGHLRTQTSFAVMARPAVAAGTRNAALFAAAWAALPAVASPGATFVADARTLRISVPSGAFVNERVAGATFFPYDGGPLAQSLPERFEARDRIDVTLVRSASGGLPTSLVGVLRADVVDAAGRRGVRALIVDALPAAVVMPDAPRPRRIRPRAAAPARAGRLRDFFGNARACIASTC